MNGSTEREMQAAGRGEDREFCEFRRKARHSELLSASTEKLLRELGFSGRLCIVVKNGTVQRTGYEEGLFESPRWAAARM